MKLLGVTVQGIKRFRSKSFLKVGAKLSALVGPNEAGKTSLLKAVSLVDTSNGFPQNLRSRGFDGDVFVEALFELEDSERSELGLPGAQIAKVRRDIGSDTRRWSLDPQPEPSIEAREAIRSRVISLTAELSQRVAAGTLEFDLGKSQAVSEILASTAIFTEQHTDDIVEFIDNIKELGGDAGLLSEDLTRHIAASSISIIEGQLEEWVPRFLYFGPSESELRDEYPTQQLESAGQFPALENLAQLVELDLRQLFQFASRNDPAAAVRPLKLANERLDTAFKDVWTQHNVAVSVEGDFRNVNTQTQIFIGEPGGEFFKPSDRSAGLRWFVALYAFLKGAHGPMARPPILLVDEADIHLHYDAQADLVREMMQQRLTAEVVYTTHSAGCLPPDLSKVRVIEPLDDGWSEVHNKFWAHTDARVSSLIIRMGASSFAFTRGRSAIATEGPSDYLLLPSLFRQIDPNWDNDSIQIVPALASISPTHIGELDREAGRVVYLTDSDQAGDRIRADLESEGIPPGRIFRLPKGIVEVEDFVSKSALADACSRIAEVVGEEARFKTGDIPDVGRGRELQRRMKEWKRSPTKVDLAEFLLDGDKALVDRDRINALRELHTALVGALA